VSAPEHAPVDRSDRVRLAEQTPPARRWLANRPGEALAGHRPPAGPQFGAPGPDQGYALKLANRFEGRLKLSASEHEADARSGCTAVALKRSALFHRAPVIFDLELAFSVWGFLEPAPNELVGFRAPLFEGVAHDYAGQRAIVDRVPEATLRMTPQQVRDQLADWRSLLVV